MQIYLVATAHISEKSKQDVLNTIEKVGPVTVVVELDQARMHRLEEVQGDRFGLERYKSTGNLKIAGMALSGELLPYASGLFYVAIGALMGTRPGGEFLAAREAAQGIGASLIYADRDQAVTMRRLQWYTRQLMHEQRSGERHSRGRGGGRLFPQGEDPGALPDILKVNRSEESDDGGQFHSRNRSHRDPGDDWSGPWGLDGDDDGDARSNSQAAMKARLLRMMKEGGCSQPNAVLAAAQRLLRAGLDPKGTISSRDVLEVRSCGTTLVENFRSHAIAGDDDWMRSLEIEHVAGAKEALGAQRSRLAMHRVIIEERDAILSQRLWEAGAAAGQGSSVVGVVGAGHVRGIKKFWNIAGTPEMQARVEEYMRPPRGEGPPSVAGLAFTGAVVGYISWKRPKAAAVLAGFVTLAMAPYLGFSVFTMRRFTSFAGKLADVCSQMESSGDMDMVPGAWGGAGAGNEEGEWQ